MRVYQALVAGPLAGGWQMGGVSANAMPVPNKIQHSQFNIVPVAGRGTEHYAITLARFRAPRRITLSTVAAASKSQNEDGSGTGMTCIATEKFW